MTLFLWTLLHFNLSPDWPHTHPILLQLTDFLMLHSSVPYSVIDWVIHLNNHRDLCKNNGFRSLVYQYTSFLSYHLGKNCIFESGQILFGLIQRHVLMLKINWSNYFAQLLMRKVRCLTIMSIYQGLIPFICLILNIFCVIVVHQ